MGVAAASPIYNGGPVISSHKGRIAPFAHALFGGAHASAGGEADRESSAGEQVRRVLHDDALRGREIQLPRTTLSSLRLDSVLSLTKGNVIAYSLRY